MYINYYLYQKGLSCPKLFYLEAHREQRVVHKSELRKYSYQMVEPYTKIEAENEAEAFELTKQYLDTTTDSLCECVFIYNDCICNVPALKQGKDGLIIYIPKGNTKLKKEYKQQASFMYYIITNCGYKIQSIYVCTINPKYIRYGKIDYRLLFTLHDCTMDALDEVEQVSNTVDSLKELLEKESMEAPLTPNCLQGCPFMKECFQLPENEYTIFDLGGIPKAKAIEYYEQGIITYQDLIDHSIELTPKQLLQVNSYLNKEEATINLRRVSYFLSTLHYPLYFLDFETFQVPVPYYEGCHPYQSIPFQYSLHYMDYEGDDLHHTYYLGDGVNDPRYELAKQLCEDIPEDACIIAYNNTLEKNVIMDLAILYEEFRDHLLTIYPNVMDLQNPFMNGDYYHYGMHGSYSIKHVLPALCPDDPSLDYSNLEEVHHGSEAMLSYIHLKELDDEAKETLRQNLINYCNLDTLAMVKIYEKLKEDIKERNEFVK